MLGLINFLVLEIFFNYKLCRVGIIVGELLRSLKGIGGWFFFSLESRWECWCSFLVMRWVYGCIVYYLVDFFVYVKYFII